jgi:DNA-binding protein HU-beta
MNKSQLVDTLANRIGDRRTAATAVDAMLQTIMDTVAAGESVSLTGFGVFEGRSRAARVARNPRTGEPVDVPAATVPAFRAGAGFRSAVDGAGAPAPRPATRRAGPASSELAAPQAKAAAEKAPRAARKGKAGTDAVATAEKPTKGAKAAKAKAASKSKKDKEKAKAK